MRREHLDRLAEWGVAFDCETDLIQPGLLSPPLVLGSVAQHDGSGIVGELLAWRDCLDAFRLLIEDPRRIIVGANISFDMLVCAVEWARLGVDLMPAIWRAYREERVFDILLSQGLHHIACGHLAKNPDGSDMRDPITNETTNRYSLAIVHHQVTGETGAKANDRYRESYHMFHAASRAGRLDDIPLEARIYPVDDARNTLRDALGQAGHMPKLARHRWRDLDDAPGVARDEWDMPYSVCELCMVRTGPNVQVDPRCWETRRHRNQHALADQCETAWAMHLGAAWGFKVDQAAVTAGERETLDGRAAAAEPLLAAGFLKRKKEKGVEKIGSDKAKIARAVASAYGATGDCSTCLGTSKVLSPKAKPVRCRVCRGKAVVGAAPTQSPCLECYGRGTKVYGPLINCLACCATGLDLATCPELSKTDPSDKYPEGQVQASRDALNESGDEMLRALADWGEDAKTEQTYIPYLRRGRSCVGCGHSGAATKRSPAHAPGCSMAGEGAIYRDRPLNLKPNPLLETDRTSYSDPIQQFPRDGWLRACLVARPGFVLCSCDYNQGELVTHAQSCLWILGWSDLAAAILKGAEPHKQLGATMLGLTYDEFDQRFKAKDAQCKDARQASKPANFGYPGGMGSAKLVLQQRKSGPDTPCPNGPSTIEVNGKKVRGYKGLRFCVLMDGAERCGVNPDGTSNKVRSWGREGYERECKPTCRRCLECADRLREAWFKAWREAKPYFRFASDCADNGQVVKPWMLERWPDLRDWVRVDDRGDLRLSAGEVVQHVSGIVRGGVEFTNASNGWFQSLLARAAKLALRRAQRECTDSSIVVESTACPGGKVSAYAGRPSPLRGNRVVVFQHDECIGELREVNLVGAECYTAGDAAHRLSEIMERALQETCPDMASRCKAPPALARRWFKSMEPMYHVVDGRKQLVPWAPDHNDPAKCDQCKAAA